MANTRRRHSTDLIGNRSYWNICSRRSVTGSSGRIVEGFVKCYRYLVGSSKRWRSQRGGNASIHRSKFLSSWAKCRTKGGLNTKLIGWYCGGKWAKWLSACSLSTYCPIFEVKICKKLIWQRFYGQQYTLQRQQAKHCHRKSIDWLR